MVDNKFIIMEEGKTEEGETREQIPTNLGSNDPRSTSNIGFRKHSVNQSIPSSKGEKFETHSKTSAKKGSILPDVFAKPHHQYQHMLPTIDDISKTNIINNSTLSLIQEGNTLEPSERPLHIPDPIGPNLLEVQNEAFKAE